MKLKEWQHVVQVKNGIIKHANVNVKNYHKCEIDSSWNPSMCIWE